MKRGEREKIMTNLQTSTISVELHYTRAIFANFVFNNLTYTLAIRNYFFIYLTEECQFSMNRKRGKKKKIVNV